MYSSTSWSPVTVETEEGISDTIREARGRGQDSRPGEDGEGSGRLTVRGSVTHHEVGRLTLKVADYLLSCRHLRGGGRERRSCDAVQQWVSGVRFSLQISSSEKGYCDHYRFSARSTLNPGSCRGQHRPV